MCHFLSFLVQWHWVIQKEVTILMIVLDLIKALVQPIENFMFYFMRSPLKTTAGLNNNGSASSTTIMSYYKSINFHWEKNYNKIHNY